MVIIMLMITIMIMIMIIIMIMVMVMVIVLVMLITTQVLITMVTVATVMTMVVGGCWWWWWLRRWCQWETHDVDVDGGASMMMITVIWWWWWWWWWWWRRWWPWWRHVVTEGVAMAVAVVIVMVLVMFMVMAMVIVMVMVATVMTRGAWEKWRWGWARMARNNENQDDVELDESQEGGKKIFQKKYSEENIWRKQCPPHGMHAMPRKNGKFCARARPNPHLSRNTCLLRMGCHGWSPPGAPGRILSLENSWVLFWVLTFLKLKSLCLTFLARIYVLRRMKFAGTNFLMPKVSRKVFSPLCYYASPRRTMLNKFPRNICCQKTSVMGPNIYIWMFRAHHRFEWGLSEDEPNLNRLSHESFHSEIT